MDQSNHYRHQKDPLDLSYQLDQYRHCCPLDLLVQLNHYRHQKGLLDLLYQLDLYHPYRL